MSAARDEILSGVRRALGRGAPSAAEYERLRARLHEAQDQLIPARARPAAGERLDRFRERAEAVGATVARVETLRGLPGAVAEYLAGRNLPARILASPDGIFDRAPWDERPALEVRRGAHGERDLVGLSRAYAAVAETGSIAMAGGADNPHLSSFVPETQLVALPASRIVGGFEEVWRLARADGMPRTLTFVTGPSRTGDIGLKIELGAHGPRRLHLIVIDDPQDPG